MRLKAGAGTLEPLDALTQINLDDLISSFGWTARPLLATILRRIYTSPARAFAQQMLEFDDAVGNTGLCAASRQTLTALCVRELRVYGEQYLPAHGPALFLSNHPGMMDTICLFAAINRADLKIIAVHRPFLVSLQNTARHCLFIDDDPAKRLNAIRQVANHLRRGGSVLNFPAGEIEPDPKAHPGAADSLEKWIDSAGLLIRYVPDTVIVPVLVSGVIWNTTAGHWLTRLKRSRLERERLAAAFQLLAIIKRQLNPTTVQLQFATPIALAEVASSASDTVHQIIIKRMRQLILDASADDQGATLSGARRGTWASFRRNG